MIYSKLYLAASRHFCNQFRLQWPIFRYQDLLKISTTIFLKSLFPLIFGCEVFWQLYIRFVILFWIGVLLIHFILLYNFSILTCIFHSKQTKTSTEKRVSKHSMEQLQVTPGMLQKHSSSKQRTWVFFSYFEIPADILAFGDFSLLHQSRSPCPLYIIHVNASWAMRQCWSSLDSHNLICSV